MKVLLDTCVFFWLFIEPGKISQRALSVCDNRTNEIYLSTASIWEIQIKILRGKMRLDVDLEYVVKLMKEKNGLKVLNIEESHVYHMKKLPSIHGDPFDRMLVAQALDLDATILTSDKKIAQYPVNVIW